MKDKALSQAERVLAVLRRSPSTDKEIARLTGLPITTVLARRWALIHRGLVQKEPISYLNMPTGSQQSIWGLTEKGRQ